MRRRRRRRTRRKRRKASPQKRRGEKRSKKQHSVRKPPLEKRDNTNPQSWEMYSEQGRGINHNNFTVLNSIYDDKHKSSKGEKAKTVSKGVSMQGQGLNEDKAVAAAVAAVVPQRAVNVEAPKSIPAVFDEVKEGREDAIMSSQEEAIQIAAIEAARQKAFRFGTFPDNGEPKPAKRSKTINFSHRTNEEGRYEHNTNAELNYE